MANYNSSTISCKNPEVLKSIIKNGQLEIGEKYHPHELSCNGINKGYTKMHVSSRNDVFHDEALKLSKKFPKEKIKGEYSFEHDWHFETHIVEYKNGTDKFLGSEYRVGLIIDSVVTETFPKDSDMIHSRIGDFADQIFKKGLIKEGEEISLIMKHDGYKIETVFNFSPYYETKVYELREDWAEVKLQEKVTVDESSLPF